MKLINQPFDGDKRRLKEFVDNVTTAFELVNPSDHDLLLKFVKTKITGEARSKLLVRDLTATWRDVKQILEENYGVRRTFDYYACRMFSSRQGVSEGIAPWSSRIDTMQSELREAAYRIYEDEEVVGAMGLINHLAKACFVQGLSSERIQTIVRSKGETALLSTCIDAALEEESAILSARERGFSVPRNYNVFKGPGRVSTNVSSSSACGREQVAIVSGRGPGFVARVESEGLLHPGRGVTGNVRDSGDGRSALRREGTNGRTRESGRELRCYACGNLGHVARACTVLDSNGWRRSASENGSRARDCSHVGPRQ
jgi:hypothetical protein